MRGFYELENGLHSKNRLKGKMFLFKIKRSLFARGKFFHYRVDFFFRNQDSWLQFKTWRFDHWLKNVSLLSWKFIYRQKLINMTSFFSVSLKIFLPNFLNSFTCLTFFLFSGNWPLPQKSRWRRRQIWRDLAKSAPCFQQQSKRKIWGGPQERD